MNKRKLILIGAGILLALASLGAWATSATISWNPQRIAPVSIAPGEFQTILVSFTNKGPSTINGKKLSLEVRGETAGVVSVTQPTFPQTIKKGESVSVNISIHAPSEQTVRVVNGTLVLLESKPNSTVKDTFTATLPLEITLSPFFIPPAPDKTLDEATIEGVDSSANGVPDRVDRFIAFAAPESEKKRAVMTLSAKAQQDFFIDYLDHLGEDPNDAEVVARVRGMADLRAKALYCRMYAFGVREANSIDDEPWQTFSKMSGEIEARYMDTPERIRVFWQSEKPLVATSASIHPETDQEFKQQCLDLGFDPDSLPN